MNRSQRSRLHMYRVVYDLLNENQAAWSNMPAFADGVQRLGTAIAEINTAVVAQSTRLTGVTADRREERNRLNVPVLKLAKALQTLAARTGNNQLKEMVRISPSVLRYASETRHYAFRTLVLQEAQARQAELSGYGVVPQDIQDLEAALAVYDLVARAPRKAINSRSEHTRKLRELFQQVYTLLTDELDPMALVLEANSPGLLERYTLARQLVNIGGRRESDSPGSDTPESGTV